MTCWSESERKYRSKESAIRLYDFIRAESIFDLGSLETEKLIECEKVEKGAWRMPWLSQAMKDVISCDKRGGGANDP